MIGLVIFQALQFIRYQIKPDTIFLYSNYSPVNGWVRDICKEGMAFEYISNGECEPKPKIRLILTGDKFPFYLPDLVCKTIYNTEADNKNNWLSKRPGLQRCGVNSKQMIQLYKKN